MERRGHILLPFMSTSFFRYSIDTNWSVSVSFRKQRMVYTRTFSYFFLSHANDKLEGN